QSTATGFTGFQIPSGGWQLTAAGQLTLKLNNMAGANINITQVQATYAGSMQPNTTYSGTIGPGSPYTIIVTGLPTAATGSSYSVDVVISYTNLNTAIDFTSSGRITGTVS
ncbi:MAG: hypothetical protein NTY20_04745, partial [Candidatus Aenigmarchaeota archaeon]|nr:hypothetical protein [Candidatus Aenigmarchaeota archaeon]